MKILLTGFEPFGKETINPSYEVLKDISFGQLKSEIRIIQIPVSYSDSFKVLKQEMETFQPELVLMFGQAGGRKYITPEMIAINAIHSFAPDNDNVTIKYDVIGSKPLALQTSIDFINIVKKIDHPDIVRLSYSTGTYVCNLVYYKMLNEYSNIPVGFIHVPYLKSQVTGKDNIFGMEYEVMKEYIYELIALCIRFSK